MSTRRDFLKKSALAGVGVTCFSSIIRCTVPPPPIEDNISNITLQKGATILFQGDSITDCRRDYNERRPNSVEQLGHGYVLLTATRLLRDGVDKELKIFNRGISSNRVFHLQERWGQDTVDLQPDVLSVLIGVNDYWLILSGAHKGSVGQYEEELRALFTTTKEQLPQVQLVLCEPFVVRGGTTIDEGAWFPSFDLFRHVMRKMAVEFQAVFVPYQAVFDEALKHAPASYWATDGIHPDLPGRQLMADAWLQATGLAVQ